MSISKRKRKCQICKEWFQPDARVANQQKTCGKPSCQKSRKQQGQKRWVKKNPEYFKGRYENTRRWLKKHPGYLKTYRKKHPEYIQRNRDQQRQRGRDMPENRPVDIQDTILTQPYENTKDRISLNGIDIQDAINTQLVEPVYVSGHLDHIDIQDDMFKNPFRRYTSVRIITRKQLRQIHEEHCYG